MRLRHDVSEQLFVKQAKAIEEVFRRAVHYALLQHKRAGNPIVTSQNGRVVILAPDQIPIDDTEDEGPQYVKTERNS